MKQKGRERDKERMEHKEYMDQSKPTAYFDVMRSHSSGAESSYKEKKEKLLLFFLSNGSCGLNIN